MIKVGLVDDHPVVRAGLSNFISDFIDLRVVAEGSSVADARQLVGTSAIDVLVIDLLLGTENAVGAIPEIRAQSPDVGILVYSGLPEEHYALNLLRLGVNGFLGKEEDLKELVSAIRTVARRHQYVSASLARRLGDQNTGTGLNPMHGILSAREMQVLLLLAKGVKLTQAAGDMNLSIKTVSTYRGRILEKLQLDTNVDLTHYAYKNHLI